MCCSRNITWYEKKAPICPQLNLLSFLPLVFTLKYTMLYTFLHAHTHTQTHKQPGEHFIKVSAFVKPFSLISEQAEGNIHYKPSELLWTFSDKSERAKKIVYPYTDAGQNWGSEEHTQHLQSFPTRLDCTQTHTTWSHYNWRVRQVPYWGRGRWAAALSSYLDGTSLFGSGVPWSRVPPPSKRLWCEAPTWRKSKKCKISGLKFDFSNRPWGIYQMAKVQQCTEAQPSWINSERDQCITESKRMLCLCVCVCVCVHWEGLEQQTNESITS